MGDAVSQDSHDTRTRVVITYDSRSRSRRVVNTAIGRKHHPHFHRSASHDAALALNQLIVGHGLN